MGVSLVALRCRTADRFAGAPRGVEVLAPLVAGALGVEPRFIGTPGEIRETRYDEDLREARGCLLEAGGQVEDMLAAGQFPVLTSSDCSICMTPAAGVEIFAVPDTTLPPVGRSVAARPGDAKAAAVAAARKRMVFMSGKKSPAGHLACGAGSRPLQG